MEIETRMGLPGVYWGIKDLEGRDGSGINLVGVFA